MNDEHDWHNTLKCPHCKSLVELDEGDDGNDTEIVCPKCGIISPTKSAGSSTADISDLSTQLESTQQGCSLKEASGDFCRKCKTKLTWPDELKKCPTCGIRNRPRLGLYFVGLMVYGTTITGIICSIFNLDESLEWVAGLPAFAIAFVISYITYSMRWKQEFGLFQALRMIAFFIAGSLATGFLYVPFFLLQCIIEKDWYGILDGLFIYIIGIVTIFAILSLLVLFNRSSFREEIKKLGNF